MTDPVTALFRIRVFTPWLGLHQSLGTPHGLELLMHVLIAFIHPNPATRREKLLTIHCLADRICISFTSLFHRLVPHIHAEIRGFDGIVRYAFVAVR